MWPDIRPDYFTFDEYIVGLSEPNRGKVEQYREIAEFISARVRIQCHHEDEFPTIRITSDSEQNAEASPYSINITHGLIEHCLNIEALPISDFYLLDAPHIWTDGMAGNILFAWCLAHEYVHIGRRHEFVRSQTPDLDQTLVSHAFEHDADLCAVGAVYRWLQSKYLYAADNMELRVVLCFGLYWSIRTMVLPAQQRTHADINARLFHICHKICILSIWTEPPDVGFVDPITSARFRILSLLMMESDRAYRENFKPDHPVMGFDWLANGPSSYLAVVSMWDELILRFEWLGR